ncbi:MAG: fumarate hydratase [Anaerorhabdus sp.]
MREFDVSILTKTVSKLVKEINFKYPDDVFDKLKDSYNNEKNTAAKNTLKLLLDNAEYAEEKQIPICQDTGMVVVFISIGQEVHFVGGDFEDAINKGVCEGYKSGYLRKSIVLDPVFDRINSNDNTPCVIYTKVIPGEDVIIEISTKGFGSENMSQIKMLKPSQGVEGIKDFVLDAVKKAGPNACPPYVVGVGIGGTFDYAAVLSKKATLRKINEKNKDFKYSELEETLIKEINNLNIGPQGLKGDTSAFGVNIEYFPTHIAGLPVAVNISCHITRHAKEIL